MLASKGASIIGSLWPGHISVFPFLGNTRQAGEGWCEHWIQCYRLPQAWPPLQCMYDLI